jgi:hypothetical protein
MADILIQNLPIATALAPTDVVVVDQLVSGAYVTKIAPISLITASSTANSLATTTTPVVVNTAGAPSAGQALMASSSTAAIWSYAAEGMPYVDATGTSDAIQANFALVNPVLYDGYDLTVGITTPNATNAPTFAPTLNGSIQTARTVVKFVNNIETVLAVSDLQGVVWLKYDLPNTKWVLMNPSVSTTQGLPYVDATGVPDAILGVYQVVNNVLYDGYDLTLGVAVSNATTTPTFAPTLNGVLQTARTIVKFAGNTEIAVTVADLPGVAWLKYDLPNTKWVLMNPAVVTATVISSFTTQTTSGLDTRTLPNGDQFISSSDPSPFRTGTFSTTASGVMYALLGNVLSMSYWTHNTALNSVGTFLGAGDTGTSTLWSYNEDDSIKIFSAPSVTAGTTPTFGATPTYNFQTTTGNLTITGAFSGSSLTVGGAVTGNNLFGVGQIRQPVTRAINTIYQNITGKPISVTAICNVVAGGSSSIWLGSPIVYYIDRVDNTTASPNAYTISAIIMPNEYYSFQGSAGTTVTSAYEIR